MSNKFIDNAIEKLANKGVETLEKFIDEINNSDKEDNQNNNYDNYNNYNNYNNSDNHNYYSDNFDDDKSDISESNYKKNLSDVFKDNCIEFKKSSNRFLIQYNNYDVELKNWELIYDSSSDYIVSGQLENNNWWNTSYIKHIDIMNDHLKVRTINNTIYRCFYTESLDCNFGRRIYF
tara:strand:+ start:606 stop:1136 length:531 start_codon:yes stop_codon:yes gene_type:complete